MPARVELVPDLWMRNERPSDEYPAGFGAVDEVLAAGRLAVEGGES